MRNWPMTLPLLLLAAACTTSASEPYNPVRGVHYSALGQNPFWLLTIGDDRIVLRMAGADGDAVWPRTLPRASEEVTIWESGDGTQVISIEARHGACTDANGRLYADAVRIRLSGSELFGCGGPLLEREPA